MRIARFDRADGARSGIVKDDHVIDVHGADVGLGDIAPPGDVAALLAGGAAALDRLRRIDDNAAPAHRVAMEHCKLLAPIANPPKIVCCWVNYPNPHNPHSVSDTPIFFSKYATAIIGPGDAIRLPKIGHDIVVEPELTAVIGTGGRHISDDDALQHVAGYTIVNDVTAFSHRLTELIGSRGPYMMAKTFDTFAPTGPWIVTSDEIADPHSLGVRQWLNDELLTDSNTDQALIRFPRLISYLSDFFTLEPGDLIVGGSPLPLSGKPTFLSDGDVVRIEIESIGTLENPVIEIRHS